MPTGSSFTDMVQEKFEAVYEVLSQQQRHINRLYVSLIVTWLTIALIIFSK